jgi:hypothetical protein
MSDKLELGFDLGALINKGKKFNSVKSEFLKEGDSFYRLIPPAPGAANRELNHKWVTHWLTGSNGKKMQVACTYFTEKYCPLCAVAKEIQAQIDRLTDKGERKPETFSEDEKAELKRLWEGKRQFEATRTFAYLAFNANNEVVALKLSSTVSQLLDKKVFQAATEYGFDPTALNGGVWFKFSKHGKGRDSVTVDFKRVVTKVNGKIQEELDQTDLPEDALNRLANSRPDIHSPKDMWVKEYSAAQLGSFLKGMPLDGQPEEGRSAPIQPAASAQTSVAATEAPAFVPPKPSAAPVELPQMYNHDEDTDETETAEEPAVPAPVVQTKTAAAAATAQTAAQSNSLAEQIARMRQLTAKK